MARLGRRERHEKRARLEAERSITRLNIERAKTEEAKRISLPRRERNWLSGAGHSGLSKDNLLSLTHYAGAYVGRSPGTGKVQRPAIPSRFLPSFMASGHERLKIVESELPLIVQSQEVHSAAKVIEDTYVKAVFHEAVREHFAKRDPMNKHLFRE